MLRYTFYSIARYLLVHLVPNGLVHSIVNLDFILHLERSASQELSLLRHCHVFLDLKQIGAIIYPLVPPMAPCLSFEVLRNVMFATEQGQTLSMEQP